MANEPDLPQIAAKVFGAIGRAILVVITVITAAITGALADQWNRQGGSEGGSTGSGQPPGTTYKTCGYCSMRVPSGAQVCPYCRRHPDMHDQG